MSSPAREPVDLPSLLEALSCHKLTIPFCGDLRSHPHVEHHRHTMPAPKILQVLEGRLTYRIAGTSIKLGRGAMLYRPAMSAASWVVEGRSPMHLMYCEFAAERIKFPAVPMWTMPADPELERQSLQRVRQAFLDADPLSIYRGVAELKVILTRFFQQATVVKPRTHRTRGRSGAAGERAVQLAMALLSEHFAQPDILTGLHDRVRMSEDHFRRLFRRTAGVSAQQYLLRIRMTAAKAYLERSNLAVKEVARLVGYVDPLYFSRMYRKHYRFAPTDTRRG